MDDNTINAKDLFGKFKSTAELKSYANDLFKRLQATLKTVEEQKDKIRHLESLLSSSVQKFDIIPPEQLTCEMEIRRLEETAKNRPLSLEEAKIFDIMTKNLINIKKAQRDLKEEPKEIEGEVVDLLRIVSDDSNK